MQTYATVNSIRTETEALFRNITGKKAFTAVEGDIVNSAIVDAYQFALLEYGISTFKFHEEADTIDTVADQTYVDLDEYVFKVVNGTVRIPAQNQLLGLINEVEIFQADPALETTGIPQAYAYTNSSDPNVVRLALWPTPDAVYTIYLKQLVYPTDVMTNFPIALQSAIKNKAKGLAVMGLGLGQLKPQFDNAYEEIIAKVKDGFNYEGPRHIPRRLFVSGTSFREDGM